MSDEPKQVSSLAELAELENKIEGSKPEETPNADGEGEKGEELKGEESKPEEGAEEPKSEEPKAEEPKVEETPKEVDSIVAKAEEGGLEVLSEEEKKALTDAGYDLGAPQENEEFLNEVETVTGIKLEVDNADLSTPEGMSKYMNAFADDRIAAFESALEERFPDAYKALQIAMDGGNPADYFKVSGGGEMQDYTRLEFKEDDNNLHKQIIADSLKLKGVSEDDIQDFITLAEDTNKLGEKAKRELGSIKTKQEQDKASYEASVAEQRATENAQMEQFSGYLDNVVSKGKLDNFNIPDADKNKFLAHLRSNIFYDNGGFHISKQVNNENINDVLKQEFFNFRKGDVADLVSKEAKKKLSLRLRKNIKKSEDGTSGKDTGMSGYTPLGSV